MWQRGPAPCSGSCSFRWQAVSLVADLDALLADAEANPPGAISSPGLPAAAAQLQLPTSHAEARPSYAFEGCLRRLSMGLVCQRACLWHGVGCLLNVAWHVSWNTAVRPWPWQWLAGTFYAASCLPSFCCTALRQCAMPRRQLALPLWCRLSRPQCQSLAVGRLLLPRECPRPARRSPLTAKTRLLRCPTPHHQNSQRLRLAPCRRKPFLRRHLARNSCHPPPRTWMTLFLRLTWHGQP